MDKIKQISVNTVVPLGLVAFIGTGIWGMSGLVHEIRDIRMDLNGAVTTVEYQYFKRDISSQLEQVIEQNNEVKEQFENLVEKLRLGYNVTITP